VALAVSEEIATLTLSRPANRNALTPELLTSLLSRIEQAEELGARVVVLAADGPAFSAGLNLREQDPGRQRLGIRLLLDAMRRILVSPLPFIARIHGPVRAGGLGLVTAADFAITADSVTFAFPEVRLGLAPAVVSTTVLPRLHSRDATRLFLTAETVTAADAVAAGLIDACAPAPALDEQVSEHARVLLLGHPQGTAATKALLTRALVADIDQRRDELIGVSHWLFTSPAAREAIAARRPS